MNEIVFLLCQIQTTAGWRGVNVGHSLSPPGRLMLAMDLLFFGLILEIV